MTGSLLAPDLVAPAWCSAPEYVQTLGPEVADLNAEAGFAPDPEQRMLLDLMYAVKPLREGESRRSYLEWAAFEFCVVCSRQNLKTGLFKMAAIGDLFLLRDELVTWTAHLFETSEGSFRDIKKLIDGSYMLSRRVKKITEGNGDEEIITVDGCRLQFKARGKSGGRGKTGAKVFLDEGFALSATHVGSLWPTTATLPGAQIRIGSSAGHLQSAVLRDIRDRGRPGSPDLAYAEWSDPEPFDCATSECDHHRDRLGCSLDDRDRWRRSNPAMGRRISEERIAAFRRSMPPEEFIREFLGKWEDPEELEAIWSPAQWRACEDEFSEIVGQLVLAPDVRPDRSAAAIGVAGRRRDGLVHLEVVEQRPGADWLPHRIAELRRRHKVREVIVDRGSAAGSLIPDLGDVREVGTAELGRACGALTDLVVSAGVRHLGQPELNDAVEGASRRPLGDAFAWDRKGDSDISPLVAVTLAAWGVTTRASAGWVVSL